MVSLLGSLLSIPTEQARTLAGELGADGCLWEEAPSRAFSPALASLQGNDPTTLKFCEREEGCVWEKCAEVIRFASKELLWESMGPMCSLRVTGGGFLLVMMPTPSPASGTWGPTGAFSSCAGPGAELLLAHPPTSERCLWPRDSRLASLIYKMGTALLPTLGSGGKV